MVRIVLEKDLQNLKNLIFDMAGAVYKMVSESMLSFENLDVDLAKQVIEYDDQLDQIEQKVIITAFEIIALQQPVARDLRFIVSSINIAKNLERIGDQAVNIAERISTLIQHVQHKDQFSISCKANIMNMAKEAFFMFESAIEAFHSEDVSKAKKVIMYDDKVDQYKKDCIFEIKECMKKNTSFVDTGIDYIVVVENLERIADLACNIAEAIIFISEGKISKFEKL